MVAVTVLIVRLSISHCFFQLKNETPFMRISECPLFNVTLLKYSSIDIVEPKLKNDIKEHWEFEPPSILASAE